MPLYSLLHNLLNELAQIENKMGFKKKYLSVFHVLTIKASVFKQQPNLPFTSSPSLWGLSPAAYSSSTRNLLY
jgi:hypothetical protein